MPAAKRTVLVVEDDRDYCELLHGAFQEAGFRTLEALNGEKALQVLRNENVDLVVSDFMMPELNGLELCRLISDDIHLGRVKMVVYSANQDTMFRRKARELGALAYLPKSDDSEEFVRQVCQLIGMIGQEEQPGWAAEWIPQVARLRPLVESLLDFLKLAALPDRLPDSTRMALEAAQRTAGDLQRLLSEIESPQGTPAGREPQPSANER
jgi:CheY-like chemotaxis protein